MEQLAWNTMEQPWNSSMEYSMEIPWNNFHGICTTPTGVPWNNNEKSQVNVGDRLTAYVTVRSRQPFPRNFLDVVLLGYYFALFCALQLAPSNHGVLTIRPNYVP
ncbi:unnamed protein product, partial [Scytosiphon promiscuus]